MSPILITGIPRSGTSVCAGLVSLAGVFGGDTVPGNRNNRKGFFENTAIRNRVVKPFLESIGADPLGQNPLPVVNHPVLDIREDVEAILKGQGWDGASPFYYKEPKIILMWRCFHESFPDARWVIVRRDPDRVMDSILRTPFMTAYQDRVGWSRWMLYHNQRIAEIRSRTSFLEFFPESLMRGDISHIADLEAFLGIEIPRDKARRFIDSALFHK